MKLFVVLAVFAIACCAVNAEDPIKLTDEQKAIVFQHAALCAQQEHASKESVQALREGKFSGADQNAKCFTNCFLEKSGFIANGQIQTDVLSAKLGPTVGAEKFSKIMSLCNNVKGADNCDTAFGLFKCYYEQNAAVF